MKVWVVSSREYISRGVSRAMVKVCSTKPTLEEAVNMAVKFYDGYPAPLGMHDKDDFGSEPDVWIDEADFE